MINLKKIGCGALILTGALLLTTAVTVTTYAGELTNDEQKTADVCIQYLKTHTAKEMPEAATPALKWCNNNLESVCDLAGSGLTKEACESKLEAWDTSYVPPPPQIIITPEPQVAQPNAQEPQTNQTAAPTQPAPASALPGATSQPPATTSEGIGSIKKPTEKNEKKAPTINWL